MIRLKLQNLAQDKGKTIMDIARETGLNRNTVTALYHNQADGIKFETIEKICSTYKMPLDSIIEWVPEGAEAPSTPAKSVMIENPYQQAADVLPFTTFPPLMAVWTAPTKYYDTGMGNVISFIKREYGAWYFEKDKLMTAAESVFRRYGEPRKLRGLFETFDSHAEALKRLYRLHTREEILSYSEKELVSFTDKLLQLTRPFWDSSLFIDTFDAGYDVEQIEHIKNKNGFNDEEVAILTTPERMTFNNERVLALLSLMKELSKKGVPETKEEIRDALAHSKTYTGYVLDFDYYKSNYAHIEYITADETADEILLLLEDDAWRERYQELRTYSADVKKRIAAVLKKHGLKQNPLSFFQTLIFWREYRKQVNLMSIHLMFYILASIEQKTGIPLKYLGHLTFDEVPNVLKGLISREQLERRYEEGTLIATFGESYRVLEGSEAQSISDELDRRLLGQGKNEKMLTGRVASQGYAKGIARIILGREDFDKFNEGEILVTSMTRPEFLPLMKKAAGIVTNEGGVTCHAAIVSRELGKPCIIGTGRATSVIKDGDLVEVRANHGTVRILS